ncbi:MAG: DUF4129 domain-containing protein [Gammaproteobacteria bacterium]|nr:DUF4129 domain-containing protein [Gammaproteobacteria bacterium]
MDVSNLAVHLRRRTPWEALDLGFGLVRFWRRHAYAYWFALVVPIWILLFAVAYILGDWTLGLLLAWWLKPLYDRILLHAFGRAAFGETPKVTDALKDWRHILGRGLLLQLTLLRFDSFRAVRTAVWYLEGQTGPTRGRRMSVIAADNRGHSLALLGAAVVFEQIFFFALAGVVLMFVAPELDFAPQEFLELLRESPTIVVSIALFYFGAVSIVEPVYVAAGFGLYLNRRVHLEGWDIEIAFKRMASRFAAGGAPVMSVFILALASYSGHGDAAVPVAPQRLPEAATTNTIKRVLESDAFRTTEVVSRWTQESNPVSSSMNSTNGLVQWLANVTEWILWGVLGGAVALILYAVFRSGWRIRFDPQPMLRGKPETSDGDDRVVSLSVDLLNEARGQWKLGHARLALSALYRGTLAELQEQFDLLLPPSATEQDIIDAVVQRIPKEPADVVRDMVSMWSMVAYAAVAPKSADVDALFADWEKVFIRCHGS